MFNILRIQKVNILKSKKFKQNSFNKLANILKQTQKIHFNIIHKSFSFRNLDRIDLLDENTKLQNVPQNLFTYNDSDFCSLVEMAKPFDPCNLSSVV